MKNSSPGRSNMFPNLFIVGAPKSGTTALNQYLSDHPEIFMGPKELHYFAYDVLPNIRSKLNRDKYLGFFDSMREEKILGECSVYYLYSSVAANEIWKINAHSKIIIMLRNPIEVIAAHHSQMLYDGYENLRNLREALQIEKLRRAGQCIPENDDHNDSSKILLYRDVVRFDEQVQRYIHVFGKERVHIIIFDDFRSCTADIYRKTLGFLEVNPNFETNFPVVNANKQVRSAVVRKLYKDPPAWISTTGRLFLSLDARTALKRKAMELNSKNVPREPMDAVLRQELSKELKPSIERLSNILGRDLTSWCNF